jgi:hypothetical protein
MSVQLRAADAISFVDVIICAQVMSSHDSLSLSARTCCFLAMGLQHLGADRIGEKARKHCLGANEAILSRDDNK